MLKLEIPVEFPEPKTVTLVQEDSSTSTSTSISTTANPDIYAQQPLSLSSLPPLVVSLILPPSYPLASPPHVASIRATNLWLPQSLRLQAILTRMWQPGEGILYNWIEFIRTGEFLTALSLTSSADDHTIRYVISADRSICWCNAQARISHPSPRILTPLLKAYDMLTKSTQFSQNVYPCAICLTSVKGSKCVQLFCGHIFCRPCLEDFWGLCIAEGEVGRVGCPDPECVKSGREANIEDVIRVVTQAEVQRYRWLREKMALEKGA